MLLINIKLDVMTYAFRLCLFSKRSGTMLQSYKIPIWYLTQSHLTLMKSYPNLIDFYAVVSVTVEA